MNSNYDHLPRAITLKTYDELAPWLQRFAEGAFTLVFLVGRPGISKSQLVRQALGDQRHAWIEGHATPLAFYCRLYEFRDRPVAIDDEYSFVKHPLKQGFMNSLCQTNPVRTVRWDSTTSILEERCVPTQFNTTSPVMVITNRLKNVSPQMAAMLDRGHTLLFQPSAAEVHRAVADWFPDREIYDFIGQWMAAIPGLSMRDYVKARDIKKANMDWRALLHKQWKTSRLAKVLAIKNDSSFATEEARVEAFKAMRYSRATYFRTIEVLRSLGMLPPRGACD
ncbi:MAG TPA: hypothetical protein VE988_19810 [Gemmataceae bacterium]|nr:hypothetical protein [Gemmataceae bacterium]